MRNRKKRKKGEGNNERWKKRKDEKTRVIGENREGYNETRRKRKRKTWIKGRKREGKK